LAISGTQVLSPTAIAQVRPDAGALLEQVAPQPTAPTSPVIGLEVEERPAAALPADQTMQLTRLRITGMSAFSETQLHALVSDKEGSRVSFAELQEVAQRITDFYRGHGYLLSRAYLPAQRIENGEVEIAVLEGRLAQVQLTNPSGLKGAALAPLERLPTDEPLTSSQLERALLLVNDRTGAAVHSTLAPGANV